MPSFGDLVRDWQRGAQAVARGDWGCALQLFSSVPDPPARICFNVGCVHLLAGDPEAALQVSQVAPGLASGTLPPGKLSSDPGVPYLLCAGSVNAVIKPRAHALPPGKIAPVFCLNEYLPQTGAVWSQDPTLS